ncbi:phage portal protein [Bradyrhizobium japonicum]|uniref:phage portal protein n=1 Tax=Bradyrhizobium japonicum TaxID=375 RepID=UPI001E42E653|nr:phage portal protein [Bradyrhizobium japonicum]MCD9819779.1 phage portal protein [Bradyrhizobium japonicum]MEB2675177.1 phage portal protein [Bradyrhizobium japonicum]WLB25050.1 phage portal protein [Bradyrhizobium japonicum]WRI85554.1 phage portal protein [Bradyrhizobium japonicum]
MGLVSWTAAKAAASAYRVYASISGEIAKERRLRLEDGGAWSRVFGNRGAAGKTVTVDSAMSLAAFWACVRVTAQAVSTLPLQFFEKQDNGSPIVIDHSLAEVLAGSPNLDQTSLEYWEAVVAWLLVNGDACSEISSIGRRVSAVNVLPNAHPYRDSDGVLSYKYSDRGKSYTLPRDKVFHVKGFGFGGDCGLSAIRYGVQTFSTALAAFETSGKLFSNGMHSAGLLTSENVLEDKQREQLDKIMQTYVGSERAGKLMILEGGLKFEKLQLNPVDAQLLQQQRFSIEEVCRWTGTPPIIIGHAPEGQTMFGSGVEQTFLAWLALGINPICERIERRITKQLIAPSEQRRIYAEFNREAFLQMDAAAKASFLSQMTQNGLMDRNEGRRKLNLPARAGGDQLTAQSNLVPLDRLGEQAGGASQARAAMLSWLGINSEAKQ